MKKIFLLLIILLNINTCFAIEEVIELQKDNLDLDYLSDLYYGKVENYDKVSPLIKLFSEKGITFENSRINSIKATFLYDGRLNFTKYEYNSSLTAIHDFNTVEPMITVKFNENKSKAAFDINLTRTLEGYSNGFTKRISRIFVSHEIVPGQTIIFGQADRLPNSYDGSRNVMGQEMILKSQLGRTLGEARSVGIRNRGEYKYIDYDIGLYDATRYMKDFGKGLDFTGYIMFKPLANIEDSSGSLKIGTGYNIGDYNSSYSMYSFFAGYDYKNFHIKAEYANADGYNGIHDSNNKAEGFYTILAYDLTTKITFLIRYDFFSPHKNIDNSNIQEYTAGITYKAFKNMKFMINIIRRNHSDKPDSNMILFATRFII